MLTEIKLSQTDKKLLAQLYHNSREPATKIASALNLSREQVSYRIKKFEKEDIIKGYLPLINYSKLGYHHLILVFFKFNKQSQISMFKHDLKESKYRITTVEVMAKYDLGMLFVFKNEKERNEYLTEMLQKYNSEISDYLILEPYFSEFYPLKFLGNRQSSANTFLEYKQKEYHLDEKERKVLSILCKNANIPIIEIAKKTNISAELLVYKLKRLRKEKVLISTRAYFNMQRIGYFYSIIFINLHNLSEKARDKLKLFAKQNEFIDSLIMLFGKPNAYIQIFHKDISELYKTIEELKSFFLNEQISIEILPLKNEGEDINALPFL